MLVLLVKIHLSARQKGKHPSAGPVTTLNKCSLPIVPLQTDHWISRSVSFQGQKGKRGLTLLGEPQFGRKMSFLCILSNCFLVISV